MLNVGPKDADTVCDEWVLVLEHADDALACGSHIGEVGNAAIDNEDLAVQAEHAMHDEVGCMVVAGEWAGRAL